MLHLSQSYKQKIFVPVITAKHGIINLDYGMKFNWTDSLLNGDISDGIGSMF